MASMAARLILTWPTWMQLQVGVQLGLYGKSHIGRIPLEIRFSTYQYFCNSNLAVLTVWKAVNQYLFTLSAAAAIMITPFSIRFHSLSVKASVTPCKSI